MKFFILMYQKLITKILYKTNLFVLITNKISKYLTK